ncbi:MAG: hypothetical protein AAFX06_22755, partial [Planctomycetota bacterium]
GGGGGNGGEGGDGADGGAGGGGGGAFEIYVKGILAIGSADFDARGGDAHFGEGGDAGLGGVGGGRGGSAGDGGTAGVYISPNMFFINSTGGTEGGDGQAGDRAEGSGDDGTSRLGEFEGRGGGRGDGVAGGDAGGGNDGGDSESDRAGNGADGQDGGDGGDGARGGVGGNSGAGAGGAGGTIKLFGSSLLLNFNGTQNAVDLFAAGGTGADAGNQFDIDAGGDGRILLGDNDTSDEAANLLSDLSHSSFVGPRATNPFLHGDLGTNSETPYIPNLLGGAAVYGFLDGVTIDEIDFDPQSAAIDGPDQDALIAVMRLPGGLADIGLDEHPSAIEFTGHDLILIANVTELNLALPKVGIGVHSDGTTTQSDQTQLAFDDIDRSTSGPQTVTALNAGQIWVTTVPTTPSTTVRVNVSIAADSSERGSVTELESAVLGVDGSDQIQYLTATVPDQGSVGVATADSVFSGFSEVTTGPRGEIYAISESRDALVVLDGSSSRVSQVIEQNLDGATYLSNLRNLILNERGNLIYAQTSTDSVAVFTRDLDTGIVSFLSTQELDRGLTPFTVQPIVEVQQLDIETALGVALVNFRLENPNTGEVLYRVKGFTLNQDTGEFTAIPDSSSDVLGHEGEIDSDPDETFVDLVHDGSLSFYLLSEQAGVTTLRALDFTLDEISVLVSETADATLQFNNADRLIVTEPAPDENGQTVQNIHLLGEQENFVTTLQRRLLSITQLQRVSNGIAGVTGLLSPVDLQESVDRNFATIVGRDGDSLIVVRLDGTGAMTQRLRNNSAGVTDFVQPVSITDGASGGGLVAATLGDENTLGGLVVFNSVTEVGNATIERDGEREPLGSTLFVLPDSFGESQSVIDRWRIYVNNRIIPDVFPVEIVPVILERDGDDWTITGVGAPRRNPTNGPAISNSTSSRVAATRLASTSAGTRTNSFRGRMPALWTLPPNRVMKSSGWT